MDKITVTSPLLPDLDEFKEMLKEIWASKWVTNNGQFHMLLEKALADKDNQPSGRSGRQDTFIRRGAVFALLQIGEGGRMGGEGKGIYITG